MANLTSVTLTAGVPTAGTGTVGTIDNVTGTAGTPSTAVLTVQGVASGTAQPVSGTVAATQSGTWTVQPGNTANTTAWKVDGSAVTQPVSQATAANLNATVKITDGTTALPILAASTGAPAASVPAVPVSIRDVNANVQSGAPVTTVAVVPTATANGSTSSRVKAAASTNATSLKASAGQIYSIDVFNNAAYAVYLKLYNKASAPTVGSDTPTWTIPVASGGGFSREFPRGKTFGTGIAYAITKLEADSDTTVVVADDLTGSVDWV